TRTARARLCGVRVHELLWAGRRDRRVRRDATQHGGPGRRGDPRRVRQAGAHGARGRGARRSETADPGSADVVPGESVGADVSFGRLSGPRRVVPEPRPGVGGGGGAHGKRDRGCGGWVLRRRAADCRLAREGLKASSRDVTRRRYTETSRKKT